MQAIEFEAVIKNGILEIPESYKDFTNVKAKIVIMKEENIDNDEKTEEDIKAFLELQELVKKRNIKVDKNTDIDELANEVNKDDLF